MFKLFNTAADRLREEQIYEAVALEISEGKLKPGLWTKALSQTNGNEKQAQSLYIKLRVQNIIDEIEVQNDIEQEMQRSATDKKPQEKTNESTSRTANEQAEYEAEQKVKKAIIEGNDNSDEVFINWVIGITIFVVLLFIVTT